MATELGGSPPNAPAVPIEEVVDGLNDLLRLDHDAIGAYEIAIEQLENREHALRIEAFKRDHQEHIRRLNEVIQSLGGAPANEPHATAPLKQAIQKLAGKAGDDALLLAWRTNELQVMTKYDQYAHRATRWPADAKRVVDENALDEERHYQWVVDLTGGSDPAEVHLANRARETVSSLKVKARPAAERLSRFGAEARLRAADGLESAAERLERLGLEREERDALSSGALKAASGFGAAADRLRSGGETSLADALSDEIQVNTGRSLAVAFAAGFVIGRLLR